MNGRALASSGCQTGCVVSPGCSNDITHSLLGVGSNEGNRRGRGARRKAPDMATRRCVSRATALGRIDPLRVPNLLTWVWERKRELRWDRGIGNLGCRKIAKGRGDGTTVVWFMFFGTMKGIAVNHVLILMMSQFSIKYQMHFSYHVE